MATRGFLIRFIDIGLIVLFGFLMISEIEMSSRVELAGATEGEAETASEPTGRVFVSVEIASDGRFVVSERRPVPLEAEGPDPVQGDDRGSVDEEADSAETPTDDPSVDGAAGSPEDARAPTVVTTVAALAMELEVRRARHASGQLETVVLIEPSPASVVQRTVDVMDVCDRLGLTKSLRMDIEVEAAPGEAEGAR